MCVYVCLCASLCLSQCSLCASQCSPLHRALFLPLTSFPSPPSPHHLPLPSNPDHGNHFVTDVTTSDATGRLKRGDEIISINSQEIVGLTNTEINSIIESSDQVSVAVKRRSMEVESPSPLSPPPADTKVVALHVKLERQHLDQSYGFGLGTAGEWLYVCVCVCLFLCLCVSLCLFV
jgi:hypothetical protein